MARPERPLDSRSGHDQARTFFVTSRTAGTRSLFRMERMANLFIDVLRGHTTSGTFKVHNFVVMPDHVHVLLSVPGDLSIEKAMQLIKGGFSYRARRDLGFAGEVWQIGFSEVGVRTRESFLEHRSYIDRNPVKAGLANSVGDYPYCSAHMKAVKQGLKPTPK